MNSGHKSIGHPVDVARGVVFSTHSDVNVAGKIRLVWDRIYSTALSGETASPLGPGWTTRYFATLTRKGTEYHLSSPADGDDIFSDPNEVMDQPDGVVRNLATFQELSLRGDAYVVTRWDPETNDCQRLVFPALVGGQPSYLASIENATGQALDIIYQKGNRVVGILQRLERRCLLLNYTPANRIDKISLASPQGQLQVLAEYEYDDRGRLVEARDPLGYADRYEYDAASRICREIFSDGGVFFFKYDDQGRCVKTSGLNGYDEKSLRYLENIGWTRVTDSKGEVTTYQWLRSGQVINVIDPLGGEEKTDYDAFGRIVGATMPDGTTVKYEYDATGNLSTIVDRAGMAWKYTHDNRHQLTSETDPMGRTWKYFLDQRGNLTTVETPAGSRLEYHWDAAGNLVEYRTPRGARKSFQYDDRGAMTRKIDFAGVATNYTYDVFGKKTSAVTLGRTFKIAHDRRGDLVRLEYPDGSVETFTYDAAANMTSATDRDGHTRRYTFGPCKRLLEKTSATGAKLRFFWGTEPEQLEAVENDKGERWQLFYDALGRMTKEVSFDKRETKYIYDRASQLIALENGAKETVKFVLDPCGRLLERHLPNGDVDTVAYDLSGLLVVGETKDSTVRIERNPLGQIRQVVQDDVGLEYTFDLDGNCVRLATSLGHQVASEYAADGHLTRLSLPKHGAYTFSFNEFEQETSRLLPGGLRLDQDYESTNLTSQMLYRDGSPTGTDLRPLLARKYKRTPAGTVLGIEDSRRGPFRYHYDLDQQLTQSLHEDRVVERFQYDNTGNITKYQSYGIGEELQFTAGNRLEQCGTSRYVHDDQGRLVRRIDHKPVGEPDVWEYSWDALDQLRSVRLPNKDLWTYKYDIFGRRVAKTGPAGETKYVWNGDTVVHEIDPGGANVSWVFDPSTFAPIAQVADDQIYSVIPDHQGSPRELISRQGQIVWSAKESVWGRDLGGDAPAVSCSVRFPGHWHDEETGLHYNRFRYYDPRTGRYISQDPIGLAGSPNFYQYVPNPLNFTDLLGLAAQVCKNKVKGDKFKQKVKEELENANYVVHEEVGVTVSRPPKPKVTTNVDLVAVDPDTGKKIQIECKASPSAKYTDNQIAAGVDKGTLVGPATISAADRDGAGRGGLTQGSSANQTVTTVRPGDPIPGTNANAPSTYSNRSWK